MSRSAKQITKKKQQTADTGSLISFIGGVIFIAAVVSFTIYNSQSIREEVERQLNALLGTTRNVIGKTLELIEKINEIGELLGPDQKAVGQQVPEPERRALQAVEYDRFWEEFIDI